MTASHTEASTRSLSASIAKLRPVPSGAAARSRSGTPSSSRHLRARRAAHGLGAHLGEPAGAVALEAREEVVGDGEAQDDVPQEGEPLVGLDAVIDPRGVGERLARKVVRQLIQQVRKASRRSQPSEPLTWAAT